MIDRLISEQGSMPPSQPEATSLSYGNDSQTTETLHLNDLPMYPQAMTSFPKHEPQQPTMAPVVEPQQPPMLQPMQPVEQPEMYFNDFNFDNITGDMPANGAMPEFEFVGEPASYFRQKQS